MVLALQKFWRFAKSKLKPRNWSIKVGQFITRFVDKFGFHDFFRSLWRRIIVINLLGLVFLIGGMFYLNGFRASLIDVKVKNLETQGKIIAAVIAASNTPDTLRSNYQGFEDLDQLFPEDNNQHETQDSFLSARFLIDVRKISPILQRAIEPTNTRARIYEADGTNLLDSYDYIKKGQIIIPPPQLTKPNKRKGLISEVIKKVQDYFKNTNIPVYVDLGKANGNGYIEVKTALTGIQTTISRVNEKGQTIVSVATPIKRGQSVLGALLISTKGVEIDNAVSSAREAITQVALIALIVVLISSMYLAGTIAGPMRSLSESAKNVKKSIKARHQIPDLTHRPDEVGQLSGALREMTLALYKRIEAIESFAADVSHELKNPLTSLKSATETLSLAKDEETRNKLQAIIVNDVNRLNRLITDISNASRLDAELVRADRKPIDISELVKAIADIAKDIHCDRNLDISVNVTDSKIGGNAFIVNGHDGRLGQVFNNLLDNAISFSPKEGNIAINIKRLAHSVEIKIDDQGPGIPADNLEKIFKRFYTDRPVGKTFGENSGLGLNISQQIVLAHRGRIWAENRYNGKDETKPVGASFTVRLPAAKKSKRARIVEKRTM